MIYTVTLNPALDVTLRLREPCRVGELNRSYDETYSIGGKGLNASRVLKILKRDSIALGFIGGYTGLVIDYDLKQEGVKSDFVKLKNGYTRSNVKIILEGREETQVNAPGPVLAKEDIMNLTKKLTKITKDDMVVVCGGMPQAFPLTVFDNLLKLIDGKHAELVVNIFGGALLRALKYKPLIVALNAHELADTLYVPTKTEDGCIKAAKRLIKMGAQNIVITRGSEGSLFVNEEMTIKVKAPKGRVISTIGSGDAFLAGFIDEYLKTKSFEKAIKKGAVVGSANAFSRGLPDEKMIAEVAKQVK